MPIRDLQDKNSVSLLQLVNNIENILSMIDINPHQARAHSHEGFCWLFEWGSVTVEVNVVERGAQGFFQVSAPLVHIPQDERQLPLLQALLARNMEMTSAALAVYENVVYVFSERQLEGLDATEARSIITYVASYADDMDNWLVDSFGATFYSADKRA